MIKFPWLEFEFFNVLFAFVIMILFVYLRKNQIRELFKSRSQFLAWFAVWALLFFLLLEVVAFVLNLQNKLILN